MRSAKILLALMLAFCGNSFGQEATKIDELSFSGNDALMTRVNAFVEHLAKTSSIGFIKLNGPKLDQYRIMRKIEGCNRWWSRPTDTFKFILGENQLELKIEFWGVPRKHDAGNFIPTDLSYRLPPLAAPIELSSSRVTDEYCPTNFDIEWFSKFLVANPSLKGKAIVDASRHDFVNRVVKYRNTLRGLGVDPARVRFLRHRFIHERDEQWWLIPAHPVNSKVRVK